MTAKPVFLIQAPAAAHRPNTWFAVHDMAKITRLSTTRVIVFTAEADARRVAGSLAAYHSRVGSYPPREWDKKAKAGWLLPSVEDIGELRIVEMGLGQATTVVKGTGMHLRVARDAEMRRKTDVTFTIDKAYLCANLDRLFSTST